MARTIYSRSRTQTHGAAVAGRYHAEPCGPPLAAHPLQGRSASHDSAAVTAAIVGTAADQLGSRCCDRSDADDHTYPEIAAILNGQGLQSGEGKPFTARIVARI